MRYLPYLKECRGSTIKPDELRPIVPGGPPHEIVLAGIGRDPRADRQYTAVLLHGFAQELEAWGREGIEISRFYAYSETIDGVYLCFSMDMELMERPRFIDGEGPFFKFVLEMEKDIPLLRPYKRALVAWKQSNQEQE